MAINIQSTDTPAYIGLAAMLAEQLTAVKDQGALILSNQFEIGGFLQYA
jgi:hypothetical protein